MIMLWRVLIILGVISLAQCKKSTPTTVYPAKPFDANADAAKLHEAIKDYRCDVKTINSIVTKRARAQRQLIAEAYSILYKQNLIGILREKLRNYNLIETLMIPRLAYYARELHDAVTGLGTDEEAIIEILCTVSNWEIKNISSIYEKTYQNTLVKDLIEDTSGDFQRLLVYLSFGRRDENQSIDHEQAVADARNLYELGVRQWRNNRFNTILVFKSVQQLRQTFLEYKNISGYDIEEAIENEFSGDIMMGLLRLVKSIKSTAGFLAERLHDSMPRSGPDFFTLSRIISSRSDIDLGDIKIAFQKSYGKSLKTTVANKICSGDLKDGLLSLLST